MTEFKMVEGVDYEMVPCEVCKALIPDYVVPCVCSRECFTQICTCKDCGANKTCEYAWDDYNTGGDCLAEK